MKCFIKKSKNCKMDAQLKKINIEFQKILVLVHPDVKLSEESFIFFLNFSVNFLENFPTKITSDCLHSFLDDFVGDSLAKYGYAEMVKAKMTNFHQLAISNENMIFLFKKAKKNVEQEEEENIQYCSAILEYFLVDIFETSGNVLRDAWLGMPFSKAFEYTQQSDKLNLIAIRSAIIHDSEFLSLFRKLGYNYDTPDELVNPELINRRIELFIERPGVQKALRRINLDETSDGKYSDISDNGSTGLTKYPRGLINDKLAITSPISDDMTLFQHLVKLIPILKSKKKITTSNKKIELPIDLSKLSYKDLQSLCKEHKKITKVSCSSKRSVLEETLEKYRK